jgi:hypothetical protein
MRCPVCKAENVQESACRRCKADLSLLRALEARRAALLKSARRHLASVDCQQTDDANPARGLRDRFETRLASEKASAAARLREGPDALQVIALANLLGRDYAGAWRAYRAAKSTA